MDSKLFDSEKELFDFTYHVYGSEHLFYLNEVRENVYDGSDKGPILKDKHYEMMMVKNRITVLNKAECGNGGTSGIVDYLKRHNTGGLILVPNVSISKSKEEKYKDDPDICCVYGGVDKIDWEAKIVIATYDQFKRLLANLRNYGFAGDLFSNEVWRDRAIFVDEYHKLVDDNNYRKIMAQLTELIIKTDLPVTLMSATPHEGFIEALRGGLRGKKELVLINVVYKNRCLTKRMGIYNMKRKDLKKLVRGYLNTNKQVYIFYNNVASIAQILKNIKSDDCEILCSEAKKGVCGKYYSKTYDPKKKIHFLTSAYFTGHDIEGEVDKVIIIGGNSTVAGAISMRDTQQILGRFRDYCGGCMSCILLMYIKEKRNETKYQSLKDMLVMTEDKLKGYGDNWVLNAACIADKLKNMYCKDALIRLEYWSSEEKLIKKLRKNGYVVDTLEVEGKRVLKAKPIGELPDYVVEPNMAYRVAFTKVANGEHVDWEDYIHINKITEYIEKYGVTRDKSGKIVIPARDTVVNLYKINQAVENSKNKTDIDEMNENNRFAAFGFNDGGVYKASYMMDCLKYIKLNYPEVLSSELDYGLLPIHMKKVFGCLMFCWKIGNKDSAHQWCVIGKDAFCLTNNSVYNIPFSDSNIYKRQLSDNGIYQTLNPIKVSYRSDYRNKHYWGRTIELNNLPVKIPSLTGISLYDWINEDKGQRLEQVKNNKSDSKRWDDIKNFEQLQISEFYKDTNNEYRYIKSEVNEIGCLIIDIDEGLSFHEFKELYSGWKWLAYPTISNTDSNWNKFRVIVPLDHPVRIEGDNNMKVLKALRSSFCAYEDKRHNFGSYVNLDDWMKKYINEEGSVYSIEQSEVDALQYLISVACDYTPKKFDKSEVEVSDSSSRRWWSLDTGIKLYEKAVVSPMEGARHAALFKIKNNLSEEDCSKFEAWLWENYPMAVKKHWKSHKRIVS